MRKLLVLCLALTYSWPATAYFQADLLKAKRRNTEATQWTLADWLRQKNQLSLMDHWLALHRSTHWFELNLSGGSQQYTVRSTTGTSTVSNSPNGQFYQADLYLNIFNLNSEYQKSSDQRESYGGAAGLRLLGKSSRTTSFTARYGWRRLTNLTTQEQWENQYLEGAVQLYVISSAGLNGQYRYYLPATSNQGTLLVGYKVTAGAFFEFLIFKIYGNYFQEPLELSSAGVTTKQQSDGFEGGVKLFF